MLCDSIRDITVGFNGINEILGVLLAERLFPGSSPDPVVIDNPPNNSQGESDTTSSEFLFPPTQNKVNPRKPLNQPPLGETGAWATAVKHGSERQVHAGTKQSQWLQETESDSRTGKKQLTKDEIFVKAVKDAEQSILVFNLDLGQQPSMNTATISSKVTLCLVNTLDKKENAARLYKNPNSSAATTTRERKLNRPSALAGPRIRYTRVSMFMPRQPCIS